MEKLRQYTRTRWRQEEPAPNADPNIIELTTPQPITAEIYYSACGKIYRHNRCRQESLDTEKKLGTKDWSKLFNLSVFEMNVVDVWLAYQCITRKADTQADLYNYLSEEMIDTICDRFMMWSAEVRRRNIVDSDDKNFDDDNPLFGRVLPYV